MAKLDLTNKKFGRLTVIKELSKRCSRNVVWECLCDCGKYHEAKASELNSGHLKSCGCLHLEIISQGNTKHGMSKSKNRSPEYNSYISMKQRCYNSNIITFHHYGGRGIKVCERWLNSFENFFEDMGLKPTIKHTLERINVNGDYELSNCRWATMKEQSLNRRNNKFIIYNGISNTLSDWSKITGVHLSTLYKRHKNGLPIEIVLRK